MRETSHLDFLLKAVFIISLSLSFVLWSVPILSSSYGMWLVLQKNSNVHMNPADLENYNNRIIEFFKTGSNLEFLNANESSHMNDVGYIVNNSNAIAGISLAMLMFSAYFLTDRKDFIIKSTKIASAVVFSVILLIAVFAYLDFQTAFLLFHKISFVNNFSFPSDSFLKTLYPDGFFLELGMVYLLSVMIPSLIVAVIFFKLK
ncbi:MAG: DUF1461 domain-containing protein [Candidatus Aenigmarchaeota archaeon]|nr:DUF1461 domain-containing protein [Candidatus Aenigmarchaeota archaeon]